MLKVFGYDVCAKKEYAYTMIEKDPMFEAHVTGVRQLEKLRAELREKYKRKYKQELETEKYKSIEIMFDKIVGDT